MKSKFSSILQVKKRALELAEAKVVKSQNALLLAKAVAKDAKDELLAFTLPTKGDSSQLSMAMASMAFGQKRLEMANEKVELLSKELAHFKHLYKQANLEFEKINYLHEQEIKAMLEANAKAEASRLDEFGTIGFARKMLL